MRIDEHANELLGVFLKHIHEVNGREVFIESTQHFNRVKHSVEFSFVGDELGGHHAASSVVLIAEQGANLGRILNAHQAKQRLGLFIRKVTNNIGCIVRVHLTQKAGSLTVSQVVERFSLVFIFQLGDNLGRARIVKVLEHLGALLRGRAAPECLRRRQGASRSSGGASRKAAPWTGRDQAGPYSSRQ